MERMGLMPEDVSEPALGYSNDWKHKDNCGWKKNVGLWKNRSLTKRDLAGGRNERNEQNKRRPNLSTG